MLFEFTFLALDTMGILLLIKNLISKAVEVI